MLTSEAMVDIAAILNAAELKFRVQGVYVPKKAELAEKATSKLVTLWPLDEEVGNALRDKGANRLRFNLNKATADKFGLHPGSVITAHNEATFEPSYAQDRQARDPNTPKVIDPNTGEETDNLIDMIITDDQNQPVIGDDGKPRIWQEVTLAPGAGMPHSLEFTDDTVSEDCEWKGVGEVLKELAAA